MSAHVPSVLGELRSPLPHGTALLSCGMEGMAKVCVPSSKKRPINCVAFHSAGRKLVTASWDATLKIWDSVEKKRLAVLRGHKSAVRFVAWSPDDVYLASASMDGNLMMWSADTGVVVGCLNGHNCPINQLRFASSGLELVTASDDHSLKIWSGTLGKQICSESTPENSSATSCAFSPTDSQLVMGYHDGTIKVHDIPSNLNIFTIKNQKSRVCNIAWCKMYKLSAILLVGYQSGVVEILSEETGSHIVTLIKDLVAVTSVTFASNSQLVAAAFENGAIRIWKLDHLQERMSVPPVMCTLYADSTAPVTSISFSSNCQKLAAVTRDMMILVWPSDLNSLTRDNQEPDVKLHGCHKDWITSCDWSDNGDYLITGSNDCTIKLWNLKKEQATLTMTGHFSAVTSVAFSHGCIVSGSIDGEVKIWSHRGVEITTLHGHQQAVNSCDILVPLSSVDDDESMNDVDENEDWTTVMDREEWKQEHERKKLNKMSKVKLNDVMVASAGDDGTCQVWKPLQGNELCTLSGHADRVVSVSISSDGQVVSSSLDKTVKVWKPQHCSQSDFAVHQGTVTSIVQSPSGNIVMTTSRDGTAALWKERVNSDKVGLKKVYTWQPRECSINCGAFINERRIILGDNDGVLTTWQIEPSNSGDSFTVSKKQEKYLKCFAQDAKRIVKPVTAMSYNREEDILYIASWKYIELLEGLAKGKFSQIPRRIGEWVTCIQCLPGKNCVAGIIDKNVAGIILNGKDIMTFKQLDVGQAVFSLTEWRMKAGSSTPKTNCYLLGLEDGSLFVTDDTIPSSSRKKKIHGDTITCIEVVNDIIITASFDSKIKLWREGNSDRSIADLVQIGQFNCQAPVSSLLARPSSAPHAALQILCGDQLGQVYSLEF